MIPLLYIHENDMENQLTRLYFEENGFECTCATSISQAAGLPQKFELILIDLPLSVLKSNKEIRNLKKCLVPGGKLISYFETTDKKVFDRLNSAGIDHFFPHSKPEYEKLAFLRSLKISSEGHKNL